MTHKKQLRDFARELRSNGTPGEAILWKYVLKGKQLNGLQWNRQFVIENFIVDFICRKLKLIIELDGNYHDLITKEDKKRDQRLNELGFKVLRISESDVIKDVNDVYHFLYSYLNENYKNKLKFTNPPNPLHQGGNVEERNINET